MGGTFNRTYGVLVNGTPTGEMDPATVSDFRLDKYDVTVGRFRQFVAAWNGGSGLEGGAGYEPPAGSGKHTHLNAGQGLANTAVAGTYETGWVSTDNVNIAPTDANLHEPARRRTSWTTTPGAVRGTRPVASVNWYEAYAFARIWDGGFLSSEAEWAYVAAGAASSASTPCGARPTPGTANQYAIYACNYPPDDAGACVAGARRNMTALGASRWLQLRHVGRRRRDLEPGPLRLFAPSTLMAPI